ncbi:hypothetical protein ACFZCF_24135 [Streptomyces sp. NPDC007945]|uniref:hypothetical protein n=1 Tax=Streptomyces sp. NPDC007945 TaxID=3364797 RepID=UPI0036E1A373
MEQHPPFLPALHPRPHRVKVAQDAGVTPQRAADEIARSPPQAVDRPAPGGSLPQGGSPADISRARKP